MQRSARLLPLALLFLSACPPRTSHPGLETFPAPQPLRAVAVHGADVWAAGAGGVIRWSERSVVVLTTADGLPSNDARAVGVAPDGSAWIGTAAGLAHVSGAHLRAFPGDPVAQVAADGKDVWAIAGSAATLADGACAPVPGGTGLAAAAAAPLRLGRLDGARLVPVDPAPPVGEPRTLAVSRGALWVGGTAGAALRPAGGGAWVLVTSAAPVTALAPDPDGRVWLATGEGIVAAAPDGKPTPLPGGDFFRGSARARAIALGSDGLWIATDKAFYNFDGSVWRRFAAPPAADGASADRGVVDVAADRATGRTFGASTARVYRLGTAAFGAAPTGAAWTGAAAIVGLAPLPGATGAAAMRAAARVEPPRVAAATGGALLDAPRVDVGASPDAGTDTLPTLGTGEGSLKAHLKGPSAGMPGNRPAVALAAAALPDDGPLGASGVVEVARGGAPKLVWPVARLTGIAAVGDWVVAAADDGLWAARPPDGAPAPVAGSAGLGARAIAAAPGATSAWAVVVDARTGTPLGAGEIALASGGGAPVLRLVDLSDAIGAVGTPVSISVAPGGTPVWLGAERGLVRIADGAPEALRAAGEGLGAGPFVHVAARADGGVWAAGCDHFSLWSAGKAAPVELPDDLRASDVGALAPAAGGGVWVGARDRVWALGPGGAVARGPLPAPGSRVSALGTSADGALWIGTRGGALARVAP